MAKAIQKTKVTDRDIWKKIVLIQNRFVEHWNFCEFHNLDEQTHDLPAEARYSYERNGFCFTVGITDDILKKLNSYNPTDHPECIVKCKSKWFHWFPGLDFRRNRVYECEIKDVYVIGSVDIFMDWLNKAISLTVV